jgi:hypothetical protein
MRHEKDGTLLRALAKYEQFTDGQLVETELDECAERFYSPSQIDALCLAGPIVQLRSGVAKHPRML